MDHVLYTKHLNFAVREFPLAAAELELQLDFAADVPQAAHARWIAEALRRLADQVETDQAPATTARPRRSENGSENGVDESASWTPPADLDTRRVKSAHRFLVAAAELGQRGPAPSLAEIAKKARLSMPPVYDLADPETPGGAYLAPLVRFEKKGRTKVVDVTPLGRKVASRVRAGALAR